MVRLPTRGLFLRAVLATVASLATQKAAIAGVVGSAIWINNSGSGFWSVPQNWVPTVANGANATADFSTLDINIDQTVHLDAARTIGTLLFGDLVASSNWTLDNNSSTSNTLTLANTAAAGNITVVNQSATIAVQLLGTGGLSKSGLGNLILATPANYAGNTTLLQGSIVSATANALPPSTSLAVSAGATFDLNGNLQFLGTLTGDGIATNSNAAPALLTVSPSVAGSTSISITGNLSFTKLGTGPLILSTPASFSGSTSVSQGVLLSGASNVLPAGTTLFVTAATFDLNGHNQQVASFSGTGSITNTSVTPALFTVNNTVHIIPSQAHLTGNLSFMKTGTGSLTLQNANTYTGSTSFMLGNVQCGINNALPATTSLFLAGAVNFDLNSYSQSISALTGSGSIINSGTGPAYLSINSVADASSNVSVSGQITILKGGTASAGLGLLGNPSLSITAGTIQLKSGFGTVNRAAALILNGSPNAWTSKLDLNNSNLIASTAPVTTISNQLKQGAHLGAWNGAAGITSSNAAAAATSSTATALAYASGTEFTTGNGFTTFLGQTFAPADTLVMYTLAGDANMDKAVTFADFLQLQNNYNKSNTDWEQGDWNYDGSTTFSDFLILQNNYNKTLTSSNITASPTEAAVPEPSSIALLLGSAGLLLRHLRRRP